MVTIYIGYKGQQLYPVEFKSRYDDNKGTWTDPEITAKVFIQAAETQGFQVTKGDNESGASLQTLP